MEAGRNPFLAFDMTVIKSDADKGPTNLRVRWSPVGGPQKHSLRKFIEEYVELDIVLLTECTVLNPCHENLK